MGEDTTVTRWPTHPVWKAVLSAQFTPYPPRSLKRHKKVAHDLEQIDAEIHRLFKLRTVVMGRYLSYKTTLSQDLAAFAKRVEEGDHAKGRDYAEAVREKARMLGKPVAMRQFPPCRPSSPRGREQASMRQAQSPLCDIVPVSIPQICYSQRLFD
jgi:hypothetical protein